MENKIDYLQNIQQYLFEVNQFSKAKIERESILPVTFIDSIKNDELILDKQESITFIIPFFEKSSVKFTKYLSELHLLNSESIYIWTNLSNKCGIVLIDSINEFNIHFPYEVNKDGIVVLVSQDLKNKIVLDFYEEDNEKLVAIEIKGPNWLKAGSYSLDN